MIKTKKQLANPEELLKIFEDNMTEEELLEAYKDGINLAKKETEEIQKKEKQYE